MENNIEYPMTGDDIENGRINIEIGFAAMKPAEFS
jgi:phage tail sheath protein FI